MSWLSEYQLLFTLIAITSIFLLIMTVVATPWLIARLPSDYLLQQQTKQASGDALRWIVNIFRCIAGSVLILLGIILMITPGPGLIVLLIGISVTQFPGKQRLLIHLATRPSVFRSLNWMRQRYDMPPFDAPQTTLRP